MPSKIRRFLNAIFFVRKASSNKNGRRIFKYARENRSKFSFSKENYYFDSASSDLLLVDRKTMELKQRF